MLCGSSVVCGISVVSDFVQPIRSAHFFLCGRFRVCGFMGLIFCVCFCVVGQW